MPFLEGSVTNSKGETLCLARPRWLGTAVIDKLYLSCSLTGIKIVVLILKRKSAEFPRPCMTLCIIRKSYHCVIFVNTQLIQWVTNELCCSK